MGRKDLLGGPENTEHDIGRCEAGEIDVERARTEDSNKKTRCEYYLLFRQKRDATRLDACMK
jgi:hypothetical protein